MSDDILRYTDLAAAIQLAKANEMTTREIVHELTRGMSYSDALRHARMAAPLRVRDSISQAERTVSIRANALWWRE